jgi:hypothetical protein
MGPAAHERRLVDHVGGFHDALELLASLCEVDLESLDTKIVPHRTPSWRQWLSRGALGAALGLERPSIERALAPLLVARMLAREPVLALAPALVDAHLSPRGR